MGWNDHTWQSRVEMTGVDRVSNHYNQFITKTHLLVSYTTSLK